MPLISDYCRWVRCDVSSERPNLLGVDLHKTDGAGGQVAELYWDGKGGIRVTIKSNDGKGVTQSCSANIPAEHMRWLLENPLPETTKAEG